MHKYCTGTQIHSKLLPCTDMYNISSNDCIVVHRSFISGHIVIVHT
jgi:hypothetical protein